MFTRGGNVVDMTVLSRRISALEEKMHEIISCYYCTRYVNIKRTCRMDDFMPITSLEIYLYPVACEDCMDKHAPKNAAVYRLKKLTATEAQKVLDCVKKVKDGTT